MTRDEQFEVIEENIPKVYEAGYSKGYESGKAEGSDGLYEEGFEAGKKAEYDAFWDIVQQGGKRDNYSTAFSRWDGEYIRPKYKVVPKNEQGAQTMFSGCPNLKKIEKAYFDMSQKAQGTNNNGGYYYMFASCVKLEEIEDIGFQAAPIVATTAHVYANAFSNCYALHTIEKIRSDENAQYQSAFASCRSLQNVTFEGVIGQNIDLHWSTPLSKASIVNIIGCLSDTASGKTLTLSKTAVENAFDGEEIVLHPYTIDYAFLASQGYTVTDNGDGSVTVNGGAQNSGGYIEFFEGQLPADIYEVSYLHEGDGVPFGLHVQVNDGADVAFPVMSGESEMLTIGEGDTLLLAMDLQDAYTNRKMKPTLKRLTWESLVASKPNWAITLV